jgi:SH3-like domain-containing protein
MRQKIAVLFVLLLGSFLVLPAFGQQSFPYKAFIAADEVYVRSGPGQNYYPTDKLSKGQEVEVHRHDPGGWCAIRPVEGSFSWISSRFAKTEEGNLAVITEENVSARVGSKFSDIRDIIQVRLHKGEVVEILETKKIGEGVSPSQTWYKIAPPSGEFRWVSLKYLEPEHVRQGLSQRSDEERSLNPGAGDKIAKRLPHEEFQAKLDQLELDFSQMVAEDPNVWSFESLRTETEDLLANAETALQRGKARLLLSRIAFSEDIKKRSDKVASLHEETDRSHKYIADLRRTVNSAKDFVEGNDRYDGVGRLEQVAPKTPGIPRFALVDESGKVRSYVTPATGVNLQKYVGQQIGIVGQRGYIPDQKAQHLTANRITILDGNVMR